MNLLYNQYRRNIVTKACINILCFYITMTTAMSLFIWIDVYVLDFYTWSHGTKEQIASIAAALSGLITGPVLIVYITAMFYKFFNHKNLIALSHLGHGLFGILVGVLWSILFEVIEGVVRITNIQPGYWPLVITTLSPIALVILAEKCFAAKYV